MADLQQLLEHAASLKRQGRFADARDVLSVATALARDKGDPHDLAMTLRELAEIFRALGRQSDARTHYEESAAILRTWGDPLKFAHTVRHLADVCREQRDFESAKKFYDEALSIYRSSAGAKRLDVANALRGAAVLADEQQSPDAERLWREACDLYRHENVLAGVANSAGRLALLMWERGEAAGAKAHLDEAIAAATRSGDPAAMDRLAPALSTIRGT